MKPSLQKPKYAWRMSLFTRLALLWPLCLFVGHSIQAFIYTLAYDKEQIDRTDYYLAKDLTILISQLENVDEPNKQRWVKQMARNYYYFTLDETAATLLLAPHKSASKSHAYIQREIGNSYSLQLAAAQGPAERFRLRLKLKDGTGLAIILNKMPSALSWLDAFIFFLQMAAIVVFTWIAVKLATRPLDRLATAAEALGSELECKPIPEDGPKEVARAAAAFNAMQAQIKHHLTERMHILASIAHDLQTPITRMRLRTDLIDDTEQQQKWLTDLNAMQTLVEEGITYARCAEKITEPLCRVDVDALLDSLMCDYTDAGQKVLVRGEVGEILSTRPNALKRIITNLVDNALKFAGAAEIIVAHNDDNSLQISVLDRGPGIAEHELTAVLQPFYRVEHSRNRNTGGTGLGLAIASQLALALNGHLQLHNRAGGGLEAVLVFPKVINT